MNGSLKCVVTAGLSAVATLLLSACAYTLNGGLTDEAQLSNFRTSCVENGGHPSGDTVDSFVCNDQAVAVPRPEGAIDPSQDDESVGGAEGSATATLPDEAISHTISAMAVGEVAYTTPWGMWVDLEGRGWLHPDYTASPSAMGTVRMRVERRDDGYHVWLVPGETYTPQEEPSYVSPADTQYVPVVAMHSS